MESAQQTRYFEDMASELSPQPFHITVQGVGVCVCVCGGGGVGGGGWGGGGLEGVGCNRLLTLPGELH